MHPILLKLHIAGHCIKIYSYGVMAAIGILLGWFCAIRSAMRFNLSADFVEKMVVYAVIAGLFGAHWLYLLQYPETVGNWLISFIWIGGSGRVWYGGFLFAICFVILYLKWHKKHVLSYLDLLSPCVALAHSVGRVGCFLHGCCYGIASDRFGLFFKSLGMKVIPTQIVSSIALLLIFFILLYIRKVFSIGKGIVLGSYLVLYGSFRFAIEFIRGDVVPVWMGLRFSQWVSIFLIVIGAILLIRAKALES